MRNALDRLREFLQEHEFSDFGTGDEFAKELLADIEKTYGAAWGAPKTVDAIKSVTKSVYTFYRLRDASVFGDESPVKLVFGGPDKRSIKFLGDLDHFYFSKFADNTREPLRNFFQEQYFEQGVALFGRESPESIDDFRKAAGTKLKNLTDRQVKTIAQTAVQRVRNWAHIGSLDQAEIELARVVAVLDERTTEICRGLNGKLIRVGVAQATIERLNKLMPGDFTKELYDSEIGKAISKEPAKTIEAFLEEDGKTISDTIIKTGRGFPPYHPNCRTRLEGVIAGVDDNE